MDAQISADLERFYAAVVACEESEKQATYWRDRNSRDVDTKRSLLRLVINRAVDLGESLPKEVLETAFLNSIPVPPPLMPPPPSPEAEPPIPTTQNKADFVRQFIISRKGVTPSEIRSAAMKVGISLAGNFPYTLLYKLKAQKEIREENGKYYQVS